MSQHLFVSGSSAKIHVVDSFVSIHHFGSSTRSTSSDSRLSIFVFHGFSAVSMSPDPCLSILFSGSSAESMSPDPCIGIHMCARSMSPDSCLSIFISQDPCRSIHMYLEILCKIHVSGSMSPIHVSTSTYPDPLHDPCINTHVAASLPVDPLRDPYLSIHTGGSCTKSTRRAFFVVPRLENTPIEILFSVSRRRNAHFDMPTFIFCGPAGETQILTSGDAFLCGPAKGKQSDRDPLGCFAQAKRKF